MLLWLLASWVALSGIFVIIWAVMSKAGAFEDPPAQSTNADKNGEEGS